MIAENPHFKNIDRAPYEIGHLLRGMPARTPTGTMMTVDHRQQAEAATQHMSNASDTLLHGLEAIGKTLFSAAECEDYPVERSAVASIAALIQHIAVELQFLIDNNDGLTVDLNEDDKLIAAAKGLAS